MSETSTGGRNRRTGLILLLVSLFAGLGMAFAAAATIVQTNGPQDETAIVKGEQVIISPGDLLKYGG